MEQLTTLGLLLGGVFVRIGIPVLITGALIYLFTRLDAHWKAEAERAASAPAASHSAAALTYARNTGCWDVNKCPEEKRKNCRAYKNSDTPCWQVFRSKEGLLKEKCLGCKVFKEAPLPVHA
jgi:hypothetical protein